MSSTLASSRRSPSGRAIGRRRMLGGGRRGRSLGRTLTLQIVGTGLLALLGSLLLLGVFIQQSATDARQRRKLLGDPPRLAASTVAQDASLRRVPAPRPSDSGPRRRGLIYLAGPFTRHFDAQSGGEAGGAEGLAASAWKSLLLEVERSLGDAGWDCFLPHRDVSGWGLTCVSPGRVAKECLEAVQRADLVLGMLEESFGTHVEVGFAMGLKKPVIVVRESVGRESFFAGALAESGLVAVVDVDKLSRLPTLIRNGKIVRNGTCWPVDDLSAASLVTV